MKRKDKMEDETASILLRKQGRYMVEIPPPLVFSWTRLRKEYHLIWPIPGTIVLSLKSQLAIAKADNFHQVSKYCSLDQDGCRPSSQ